MIGGLLGSLAAAVLFAWQPSPDTLRVSNWLSIGPLASGPREGLVDPLWPEDPASVAPAAGDSLPSLLAPGGWVHWIPVTAEVDRIQLGYKGVDWDALADQWGAAGLVSAGFLYGDLQTGQLRSCRIEAIGVSSLYIDGKRYLGNPYTSGSSFSSPVRLDAGRHRLLLRVPGMGAREVQFRLIAEARPVVVLERDLTLPDLVESVPFDGWGAAPVANLSGAPIHGATLRFGDGERIERACVAIPPLEPDGILKVAFPVRGVCTAHGGELCPQEITLALEDDTYTFPCSLRVRGIHASRINTFRSHQDGSIQRYAVLPPSAEGEGPFALILSLHGAGVEPEPQVRSYSPKDWAYVVAPTNTRPFGFDWQDWGRRNAIETLEDVLARYPIDPDRVILAGHSMGGHGTWHVGLAHTDRFAALAPSAGWASFATYVPFTLRRDVTQGDPRLLAIWQRAMAPDNPLAFMANARGLPIFVLHGEKDDNVPVFHGRLLSQRAREEGAEVIYREEPGMGHWWDRSETPGVDCLDLPEMMEFLRAQRRDPHPSTVSLRTADLGTCDRMHWLTVEQALHPFDPVEVDARVVRAGEPGFELRTSGARAIRIEPTGLLPPGGIAIRIDGEPLRTVWRAGPVHLRRDRDRWALADHAPSVRARGPIKVAFFELFVLVYGTKGSKVETTAMREQAVLDAQGWYQRADGYAPVLADTAVTAEILAGRNLILYATPGSNAVLERIAPRLPIRIDSAGVTVGSRRYEGPPLAARFAYANPLAPAHLVEVIAGTDVTGFELAAASNPCTSASGYPDFVVYGAAVRQRGWGAMLAAGFYDDQGRVPEEGRDAYLR